jgi:hypothetical protein
MINIKVPLWMNGGMFGVADRELVGEMIEVKCSYKTTDGHLLHPHTYKMRCGKAKLYPTKVHREVLIHYIPIRDFEVILNASH